MASILAAQNPVSRKHPGLLPLKKVKCDAGLLDIGTDRDLWLVYYCPNPYMYIFQLPNVFGNQFHSMRLSTSAGNDTLIAIAVYFYTPSITGSPDARLTVRGVLGGFPDSTSILYTAVIPYDSIGQYPGATVHTVSGVVVDPDEFHIGVSVENSGPNDTLATISDAGYCGDSRATFSLDGSTWYYVKDYWGADVDFLILAYLGGSHKDPVWYVDPNGDDIGGDGSPWNPYAAFQRATD
jgi:hypothetical protein